MLNDGINDVPEKTLVIIADDLNYSFDPESIKELIDKPERKRDWFRDDFYQCLPLAIGNQYGIILKSQYDVAFEWDGGEGVDSVKIIYPETGQYDRTLSPNFTSWFGRGTVTVDFPFSFKTPPGVNLMSINPPNYILPNLQVMTGVVETDNIRRNFTITLKLQMPGVGTYIPKGYPFAALLPIPRYFGDKFDIKLAEEVFSEDLVVEEIQTKYDEFTKKWELDVKSEAGIGREYYNGLDVYGNKFKDHQKPGQ
jgi:hypothetical protein